MEDLSNDPSRYDEEVERIMWLFIAHRQGFASNNDLENTVKDILFSVQDPLHFTLNLVKWTQVLLLHRATDKDVPVAKYLADFVELLAAAQGENP